MLPNNTKSLSITLAIILTLTVFTSCDDDTSPNQEMTVLETLQTNDNFTKLGNLVSAYDLTETLSSNGPLTVFAPTDAAFSDENLDEMSDEEIKKWMTYHIIQSNISYADLQDTVAYGTMSADSLYFTENEDGDVMINQGQAFISGEGTEASNGTVFAVDSLLTPMKN